MFKVDKNADTLGTSFHGITFLATPAELVEAFGDADNSGDDKVNLEWLFSNEKGDGFTVYDWKEYRRLDESDRVEWHIGSMNPELEVDFRDWVIEKLSK